MTNNEDDQVMTIGEVAGFLRLSRSKVYRLLNKGELPGKRIGRQWRIWRPALEAYLEEQNAPPAPASAAVMAPAE